MDVTKEEVIGEKHKERFVVTHEGKLAGTVEFRETQTVLVIEKAFTNWSRQIVRAVKDFDGADQKRRDEKHGVAPAVDPDDIVL